MGDGGFDPFETLDDKYKKDKFYVKGLDGESMPDRIQVRLPASITRQISVLVASRLIPAYKTNGDVIRDAVMHRLHEVADLLEDERVAKKLRKITEEQMVASEAADIISRHKEYVTQVNNVVDAARNAILENDKKFADNVLEQIEVMLVQASDPYKKKLQEARHMLYSFLD